MAGREDWQARCLREKRALKRRARGSDSEQRVLRRARMVGSAVVGGGDVAEGAMAGYFLQLGTGLIVSRSMQRLMQQEMTEGYLEQW